jgi:hypothetical protein
MNSRRLEKEKGEEKMDIDDTHQNKTVYVPTNTKCAVVGCNELKMKPFCVHCIPPVCCFKHFIENNKSCF